MHLYCCTNTWNHSLPHTVGYPKCWYFKKHPFGLQHDIVAAAKVNSCWFIFVWTTPRKPAQNYQSRHQCIFNTLIVSRHPYSLPLNRMASLRHTQRSMCWCMFCVMQYVEGLLHWINPFSTWLYANEKWIILNIMQFSDKHHVFRRHVMHCMSMNYEPDFIPVM